MEWTRRVRRAGTWAVLASAAPLVLTACGDALVPPAAERVSEAVPAPPPIPATTPHDGHWIPLGDAALLEFRHDANWGHVEIWLYDRSLGASRLDRAPVINARLDDEAVAIEGSRGMASLEEDVRSWTFEHDALLGEPERARFRLQLAGKSFTPAFAHPHGGHGHETGPGHGAAPVEDGTPHAPQLIHGKGPNEGILHHLGNHVAHLEVRHDPNMGTVLLWLHDEALRPLGFDRRPVLHALLDEESVSIEGAREDDEGHAIDGWWFEDTALLGIPDRARFRLAVRGGVYTPDLVYVPHGEEPGHSHDGPAEDDVLAAVDTD